jgi:hypothetical protein
MLNFAVRNGSIPHRPHVSMLVENNARQGFFEAADFEDVKRNLPPYLADAALLRIGSWTASTGPRRFAASSAPQ